MANPLSIVEGAPERSDFHLLAKDFESRSHSRRLCRRAGVQPGHPHTTFEIGATPRVGVVVSMDNEGSKRRSEPLNERFRMTSESRKYIRRVELISVNSMIGVALTAAMRLIDGFRTTSGWRHGLSRCAFELTVDRCGLAPFEACFLLWVTLDTFFFMEHEAMLSREQLLGARPSLREDVVNDDQEFVNALLDAIEGPADLAFDDLLREAESPPRAARRKLPRIVTPDKSVAETGYRVMASAY
jgi:hypothetical protein